MRRRDFVKSSLFTASALSSTALIFSCTTMKSKKEKPKILILGDSISIGYTPHVVNDLAGHAYVSRPYQENGRPENCAGTTNGVKNIERWIGNTNWDIIHFNFGLHDLKHVKEDSGENSNDPNDPLQADPQQYETNLRQIVKRLMETKAKLIFATTTPYPDTGLKPLRDPGLYKEYNRRAVKVMNENNIQVNDLASFVKPQMEVIQKPENVHFTEEGSKALASQVVKQLEVMIAKL